MREKINGVTYELDSDYTAAVVDANMDGDNGLLIIPASIECGGKSYAVTSIGEDTSFDGVTSIVLPDSITEINDGTFWCCRGLTSIVIPKSVKRIGCSAFKDCIFPTPIPSPKVWLMF